MKIIVDAKKEGRQFQGIGAVTSNGMSRLLYDYPDKQREEILDLLFTPKYGASLHVLKVEIGSDANGTGGTEPSHMRSCDDFDISRGVGLKMATSAKNRNKSILLDAIRWGTPAWITDNEKKYLYYVNFLKGARNIYNLEFDYLAPDENEGDFDVDWVTNILRPRLNRDGFQYVKLSGADSTEEWNIVPLVLGNPDLKESISVIDRHYKQDSPRHAKELGLPIFNSEDLAPFRNKFSYALDMAYKIIRSYSSGRMVQYVMHPIIESMYDSVPYSYKAILVADEPWTGHYKVLPGLWVVAHFTQFMDPGWVFLDSACYHSSRLSSICLKNPKTNEISLILLNRGSSSISVDIELENIDITNFHVWQTNEKEQFKKLEDITIKEGKFTFEVNSNSIYTLTTTVGQKKGDTELVIEPHSHFSLPYSDDFESYNGVGVQPRYTVDQAGAFEISEEGKNSKYCLKQVLSKEKKPFDWERRPTPLPYTILGGEELRDYSVSVDFFMEEATVHDYPGFALLGIRCNLAPARQDVPECYNIKILYDGRWILSCGFIMLSSGIISNFSLSTWHKLCITCEGNRINAFCDNVLLTSVINNEIASGNVVLGSGYNIVRYDNLQIESIKALPYWCNRYSILHQGIKHSSEWREIGSNPDHYFRTLVSSCKKDSWIEFSFTGTGFSIIGPIDEFSGVADVYLDDCKVGLLNAYRDYNRFRRNLFSLPDLEDKEHKVRIVVKDECCEDSGSCDVKINAIEIIGILNK